MKPRIYILHNTWRCSGGLRIGMGATPALAFAAWERLA